MQFRSVIEIEVNTKNPPSYSKFKVLIYGDSKSRKYQNTQIKVFSRKTVRISPTVRISTVRVSPTPLYIFSVEIRFRTEDIEDLMNPTLTAQHCSPFSPHLPVRIQHCHRRAPSIEETYHIRYQLKITMSFFEKISFC